MLESALLQTHFDVIPFGIYVVDVATYELVFINRHYRESLGPVEGGACYKVLYDNDAPCLHCRIPQVLTAEGMPNGQTAIYDYYNERDEKWAQIQEKAMGWPDGRVVKYAIAVDISQLKDTQNRLAEAHAELAIRNRELARQNTALMANMDLREHVERIARHDLKAPLSALIGLPQVLQENYDLPPEAAHIVGLIEQAAHSMLDMLNQSLVLYRLETGAFVLTPHPLDILDLASRTCARLCAMAISRGRTLETTLSGGAVPAGARVEYAGDDLLLGPMLQNLLVNALEASPDGGRVAVDVQPGPQAIRLVVTNVGEVPPEIRSRMFDKYVTVGKRGGTGLGAYSAALAAKAHGGDIALDAGVPGHTTIIVTLPRVGVAVA
ncbi:PAS domain-containing sensor histidine kinase [Desulfovibrio sp. TomC]|uniref:PAS domain-containing sensor histidine kinase n=1 Tax=Desulfovibrio sp. TomC TaxID=1562888 RepID=UPI001E46F434|nr:HAMP domain-containing sensor histidine kinase [Desulfovibrio sp. TomC]